jgi:hypothetical protein
MNNKRMPENSECHDGWNKGTRKVMEDRVMKLKRV